MSTALKSAPVESICVPIQELTKSFLIYNFGREPLTLVDPFLRSQVDLARGFLCLQEKTKASRSGEKVMIEIELAKGMKADQFDNTHLYRLGNVLDGLCNFTLGNVLEMGGVLTTAGTAARIVKHQYDFDEKHDGKLRQQSNRQAKLSRLKRGQLFAQKV